MLPIEWHFPLWVNEASWIWRIRGVSYFLSFYKISINFTNLAACLLFLYHILLPLGQPPKASATFRLPQDARKGSPWRSGWVESVSVHTAGSKKSLPGAKMQRLECRNVSLPNCRRCFFCDALKCSQGALLFPLSRGLPHLRFLHMRERASLNKQCLVLAFSVGFKRRKLRHGNGFGFSLLEIRGGGKLEQKTSSNGVPLGGSSSSGGGGDGSSPR